MFHSEENLVKSVKPHWIGLIQVFFWYVVAIAIPLIWWVFFGTQNEQLLSGQWLFWLAMAVYAVLLTFYVVFVIISWYGNHAYITDKRIFVTQHGYKSEKSWVLDLGNVVEVRGYYPNYIAKLLKVGVVIIKTARDRIVLRSVISPALIQQTINDLLPKHEETSNLVLDEAQVAEQDDIVPTEDIDPHVVSADIPLETENVISGGIDPMLESAAVSMPIIKAEIKPAAQLEAETRQPVTQPEHKRTQIDLGLSELIEGHAVYLK